MRQTFLNLYLKNRRINSELAAHLQRNFQSLMLLVRKK